MPQGCTTWPAFWTVIEDGWPKSGEIDIIEGVNDVGRE
jgi:beta-glucanase (GH16 family)